MASSGGLWHRRRTGGHESLLRHRRTSGLGKLRKVTHCKPPAAIWPLDGGLGGTLRRGRQVRNKPVCGRRNNASASHCRPQLKEMPKKIRAYRTGACGAATQRGALPGAVPGGAAIGATGVLMAPTREASCGWLGLSCNERW